MSGYLGGGCGEFQEGNDEEVMYDVEASVNDEGSRLCHVERI